MRYFYYLVTVFLILECGTFAYNVITGQAKSNNLSSENFRVTFNNSCVPKKPDIFFIVLDSYASSKSLKDEFNYDNSEIDSLLTQNQFYISKFSKSNYNITPFSLSSTLNLDYLKAGLEKNIVSSKTFLQAMETLKTNKLEKFLAEQGYTIKNYGCFDMELASTKTDPYFKDLYYSQVDNQTFSSRLWQDIGWNFTLKNIFTRNFQIPEGYKRNKAYHLFRNEFNLKGLINELETCSNTPKFVYAHLILPHEPYFLDSVGNLTSDTAILLNKLNIKEAYIGQVKYSNSIIKKIITAVSHRDNEKAVIIEGDHGYRNFEPGIPEEKVFMNLNTYYFSDGNYKTLYDNISPVNSFRVILNKYFCQSMPLLKDSSIFLTKK